jgi:hypothetical protein
MGSCQLETGVMSERMQMLASRLVQVSVCRAALRVAFVHLHVLVHKIWGPCRKHYVFSFSPLLSAAVLAAQGGYGRTLQDG